jgi:LacI family transcriptional regulator
VPDIANPYYPDLSRGAEDVASAHGYALIICNTDHRAAKLQVYLRLLKEKRVDGVLLAGGGHEDTAEVEALAGVGLPIHAIGRHPLDAPAVRIDNVEAGRLATKHLLDRGRSRIAFLGGPSAHTTVADRRRGYEQALSAAGLRSDAGLELEVRFSPADGGRAAQSLLAASTAFDGIFAFNDYLAIGAINMLIQAGRRVPEDVAVIGFDDIPLAAYFCPSLSSVAVPAYELGSVAADRLIRQLGGECVTDTVWLSTRVVPRQSTDAA